MAEEEVARFLTHLARDRDVAPSFTQNQALSALLFLYKEVLKHEIGWLEKVERAKKPPKLPVVLSRTEVKRIFAYLHGVPKLMAGLLYGSGLRLMECVRLRIKDVDFELAQITVRDAKGGKDRVTMLPFNLLRTPATASGAGEGATRAGSGRWIRQGSSAICAWSKVAQRRTRMGLAICFSFVADFGRSARRKKTTASHGRRYLAERIEEGRRSSWDCQARELPQPAAFIRDAPAGKGL